jgi:hypothetical protein
MRLKEVQAAHLAAGSFGNRKRFERAVLRANVRIGELWMFWRDVWNELIFSCDANKKANVSSQLAFLLYYYLNTTPIFALRRDTSALSFLRSYL